MWAGIAISYWEVPWPRVTQFTRSITSACQAAAARRQVAMLTMAEMGCHGDHGEVGGNVEHGGVTIARGWVVVAMVAVATSSRGTLRVPSGHTP